MPNRPDAAGPSLDEVGEHLLQTETRALLRWCQGDPSGFLDICADDVVYIDPFVEMPIAGLPALTAYFEDLRGGIEIAHFQLLNPQVQLLGPTAVLSYNFVSHGGDEDRQCWNCSEVFRLAQGAWKLVHTHWSYSGSGQGGS